jgi:hypothetical protein
MPPKIRVAIIVKIGTKIDIKVLTLANLAAGKFVGFIRGVGVFSK